MSVRNLDKIFHPRRVAVIGATERPGSVGRAVMHNLVQAWFPGEIVPVNPRHATVHGLKAYTALAEIPGTIDLAVICTPGPTVPDLVRQCGEGGVGGMIILTAGFGEAGEEGRAAERQVAQTLRQFPGLRALGPNCLGILVPHQRLNASFAAEMPAAGQLAFLSQSGALCTSVLDWAMERGIGFSHFVSVGNMLDVDFGDLIDYLAAEPETQALLLYVESITNARKFLSAARAFARVKPIVAYKGGRFAESAQAALSHTGAMAAADDVYDAAFRRAGIERVDALEDLFDCAGLLARRPPTAGPRLAIVTNAGGAGVVTTDALIARGGKLAELSQECRSKLDAILPAHWSRGNPVDVLGDAPARRLAAALRIVLDDKAVDAALVVVAPQALTDPADMAQAVVEVAASTPKSILAAWMGARQMEEGIGILTEAGLPVYRNAEDAVTGLMHLASYARNLDILYETPREIPMTFTASEQQVQDALAGAAGPVLTEDRSKAILAAYGIPVAETLPASTADDAVAAARRIGFPVVLKLRSEEITHKTDVGGVALNLEGEAAVRSAFTRIVEGARSHHPEASIDGVTVQPMVSRSGAVELILGTNRDPVFGAAIMVGAGGTMAELLRDRMLELPPLNERLARRMLESLRIWPLLEGYRGRPPVDVAGLVETLVRFSYLVANHPEVAEIDINPLIASPEGVIALDARVILAPDAVEAPARPFSHLAIRPYPDEYTRSERLSDGTPVVYRAIRPEDEPMWHGLLARCSPESIWFRLGSHISHTTHKMASRYCFIDYEREIAIVVEHENKGERSMMAVGRLVAGADLDSAEFAILVDDHCQGKGLGSRLTEYCLDVARSWGVGTVTAVTLPANTRMVKIFRRLGFQMNHEPDSEWIVASLDLAGSSSGHGSAERAAGTVEPAMLNAGAPAVPPESSHGTAASEEGAR